MSLVTSGLGSPDLVVTYGLGAMGVGPTISTIIPDMGTIRGGTNFILVADDINNDAFVDSFPGSSLSSRWTNISSGGGTVTINNGLNLKLNTSGGTAGIQSTNAYDNFDITVTFSYDRTIETLFPNSNITFMQVSAVLDSDNRFSLGHIWDPTKGSVLQASVTIDGVQSILFSNTVNASSRSIRLVRFGGHLQTYVGGIQLIEYFGWSGDSVNIQLESISDGTPIQLSTTVSNYIPALLVTFNEAITPTSFTRSNRIGGSTPPYPIPVGVEVIVHTINSSISLGANSFQYVAPLQLTISNNNNELVINNDDTLRDSSAVLKGLRI